MLVLIIIFTLAVVAAVFMIVPPAEGLGDLVKIIYFHVPTAWLSVAAFVTSAVYAARYLKTQNLSKDELSAKAKEAAESAVEAAKKPAQKARAAKLEIVVQSVMGGAITTEEIAAKVPKDAISAYVKVEENKIYWVDGAGETGSVEIWA